MDILLICIGIIIGILVSIIYSIFKVSGTLRVDTSDPDDQPYLFLELLDNPMKVKKKKYVIFKVNPKNYISHD